MTTDNPLLAPWDTPFEVPPFDKIEDEHYLPAFRRSMEVHQAEVEAIVNNTEPPAFENTVEALERSGKALTRVSRVFFAINAAHSNEAIREVARTVAPELAAHRDDIMLNSRLFERVDAVYNQREALDLDDEQQWLLQETHKHFVRAGVSLDEDAQVRLREINSSLAALSQQFGQNLLADTNDFELHVSEQEDLGKLPESLVAAAAKEAERRGREGGWSFTLSRSSIEPFLQYSPNRVLRRQMFEGYALLGNNGNDQDNKALLASMASLRAERAQLLGYESHAHYVLADSMAETPDRVYAFLDQVWQPTLVAAEKERLALEAMMHEEGVDDGLKGWDWRYYAEKVRKARYDLDEETLRPYFEFNAVREGAYMVAAELFGLVIEELEGMPAFYPDQQVFEVKEADGSHIGLLYMDYFARASKRSGAWMTALRSQSKLDGRVAPIVTNTFNYPAPTPETPALLSFSEAQTLFHEFGHALHGLLSDVRYESLSGTNVPRDFVEFPSQVMENWMSEPEVLRRYARHYQTGEIIPDELIEKIKAADTFNQGFATMEYMAASYLDMAWHTMTAPAEQDVQAFEQAEMDRIGLIGEILPRYRSTYFAHVFSGGYSSGYYSYLWAEVLDADAFEAFKETSIFDKEMAGKYRHVLSKGGSQHGMDLYRAFRGREPHIDPLLVRRGLKT